MPTYRPPYVGLQYSEALTDAYVHTPSDDPVLVTLELHHTDWATPVRVVNDWTALSATLEADAPNDPATEVEFSGIPFTFSRPAETDSGAPSAVTITVDNLSQIITQMIVDVQESEEPIQVYIRTYLRTDTSAPHELPVVKMWVQSPVQITSSAAQLSCSFGDLTNRRFPKLLWRRFAMPSAAFVVTDYFTSHLYPIESEANQLAMGGAIPVSGSLIVWPLETVQFGATYPVSGALDVVLKTYTDQLTETLKFGATYPVSGDLVTVLKTYTDQLTETVQFGATYPLSGTLETVLVTHPHQLTETVKFGATYPVSGTLV